MSQSQQTSAITEKVQELNRRLSQDMSDAPLKIKKPTDEPIRKEPNQNCEKPIINDKSQQNHTRNDNVNGTRQNEKNPFSPHFYRQTRQNPYDIGSRAIEFSPHRGHDISNRLRDYSTPRSSSIQGQDFIDHDMYQRNSHYGSQMAPGVNSHHPDVVFRQDLYGQVGFPPARPSRFSSQEYLDAPGQYGRWSDYKTEYRQRRRSQQDLLTLGQSAEPGEIYYCILI